jgi:Spherulation-specific family 4
MRQFGVGNPPFLVRVVVAAVLLGLAYHSGQACASSATVLVPAYFYPAGAGRAAWDRLAEDARTMRLEVILNPASGPGKIPDPNYVAVVDQFRKAGGRVLGYVDSGYGKRDPAAVEQDIRTYLKFYKIDGFFIDQMANTSQALGYYETIYRLIKQLEPEFRVVGNPGTPYTLPAYLKVADTLVIFEGSATAYVDSKPLLPAPWIVDYPSDRFGHIIYDVGTAVSIPEVLAKARKTNAGAVYITDKTLPNPYGGLPKYWAEEVAAIRDLDVPEEAVTIATASPQDEIVATALPGSTANGIAQRPHPDGLFRRLFRLRLDWHGCRPARAPGFGGPAGR